VTYPDGVEVPGAVPVDGNGGADPGTPAGQTAPPAGADPPNVARDAPQWYGLATREIGKREIGNTNNRPETTCYRQLAQCGQPGDSWCAIFVNAMFASFGPPVPGTRSPSSQSFRSNNNFVKLSGPALGAVVVFWRESPDSGKGHVGFYRGETAQSVYVLGDNEDNMVQIEPMPKNQLIGYWWPASVSLPVIAPIAVAPGTPHHTQVT
jgi:uncharacterized protein (TIGR02594 family)